MNFAPLPTTSPRSFAALLTEAVASRRDRACALNHGVDESALLRYANGAVSVSSARESITHVVGFNQWSRERVVHYVKRKRKLSTLRNVA